MTFRLKLFAMSRFEQRIKSARQYQRSRYGTVTIALACGVLIVALTVVYTTGTSVKIAPSDAAQTGSISVEGGIAVAVSGVVYAVSSKPVVAVSAPGFRTASRQIQPHERGGVISITLQELPGRLLARCTMMTTSSGRDHRAPCSTSPAGDATRWTLNDDRLATGAQFERELLPGEYRIGVNHPYYQTTEQRVTIGRGQKLELDIPLQEVEGEIFIQSLPAGASVTLNDVPAGTTPFRRRLAGGKHQIDVSLDGYAQVSESVEVTNDAASVERSYRLRRPTATLAFEVSPPNGNLLVNGKRVNPAQDYSVPANTQLDVTYLSQGYTRLTRKVVAPARQTTRVRLHLQPEFGRVDIRSQPQTRVFIDGTEKGATPLSLSLAAKPQTVSLRRPGYRTIDKRIRPSSTHPTVIDETLVTEFAARLAEAPKQYTNSAGVKLALFHPTRFTMGAPRHQKGQRANEFERQVTLTKPFYSGKYEITNAEFRKFKPDHGGSAELPVTSIRWIDAAMFCNWLSRQEGLPAFYRINNGELLGIDRTSDGYRLLTEAEWEWLTRRAGRKAGTVFPWGDESILPPQTGNVADESAQGSTRFYVPNYVDGHAGLAPVGSFPAESSGLHDLTGNVSEWVHDYYSIVADSAAGTPTDPLGPAFGQSHVIKGSSWRSGSLTPLRAAYRDGLREGRDDVGFRIARYLYAYEENAKHNHSER